MKKYETIFKNESFYLCKGLLDKGTHTGYWFYDAHFGMNLAMQASSEREAFIKALEYYKKRFQQVEQENKNLKQRAQMFLDSMSEIGLIAEDCDKIKYDEY